MDPRELLEAKLESAESKISQILQLTLEHQKDISNLKSSYLAAANPSPKNITSAALDSTANLLNSVLERSTTRILDSISEKDSLAPDEDTPASSTALSGPSSSSPASPRTPGRAARKSSEFSRVSIARNLEEPPLPPEGSLPVLDVDASGCSVPMAGVSSTPITIGGRRHFALRRSSSSIASSASTQGMFNHPTETPEIIPLWWTDELLQTSLVTMKRESRIDDVGGKAGDVVTDLGWLRHCVFPPLAPTRIIWDIFSVLVISYDLMTLPLVVFDFDRLPEAKAIGMATTFFWVADIIFNFFVGFHLPDGRVEMRIKMIVSRYLRSWFVFDFSVSAIDLTLLIIDFSGSQAVGLVRIGKTARAVRVTRCIRMFRLVRVIKLISTLETLCDVVFSGPLMTFFNIGKLLVGLAMLVHFMACSFYAVGLAALQNGKPSWVTQAQESADDSMLFRYVVAYHWSMSQFTPAPNNYHPQNLEERAFAVCILFIGLVLFSSLLGTTTALLNQSTKMASQKLKESDSIRRFLVDNNVSLALGNKILRHLKGDRRGHRTMREKDLPLLKGLPMSLQTELHFEVFAKQLKRPFVFLWLQRNQREAMADACHTAMLETNWAKGDEAFHYRTYGSNMLIVLTGSMEYYVGLATLFCVSNESSKQVLPRDRLSEAVLWVRWEHRGLLTATSPSSGLKILADQFRIVAQRHHTAMTFFKQYVKAFSERLNWDLTSGQDVDDTYSPFTTEEDFTSSVVKPTFMKRMMTRQGLSQTGSIASEFLDATRGAYNTAQRGITTVGTKLRRGIAAHFNSPGPSRSATVPLPDLRKSGRGSRALEESVERVQTLPGQATSFFD